MTGWSEHLGPWKPVHRRRQALRPRRRRRWLRDLRLARRDHGAAGSRASPHSRCVVMIEACEESGSYDLPYYVDHLAARIGKPSLIVCLDSGCGNYDQLWLTTSLRGMTGGNLIVKVLEEGVHSGDASGVVASSFRILRQLLSRLEDEVHRQDQAAGIATSRFRRSASRRRSARPRSSAMRSTRSFRWSTACSRWRAISPSSCSTAPGGRRLSITGVGGIAGAGFGRQRAASVHGGEAFAARAADARCGQGRRVRQEAARERSAVRREGQLRAREGRQRLERAGARAVARAVGRCTHRASSSARRPRTTARAARFRSWACSARNFPARSS